MMYEIKEVEKVCANCLYYIQHYYKREEFDYVACNSGHCTFPNLKDRKPSAMCEKFKSRVFIEAENE